MKKLSSVVRIITPRAGLLSNPCNAGFLGIFLLSLLGCTSSPDSYTFHNENVKGPVQKVVERTFNAVKDSAGWNTGDLTEKQVFIFNAEGRLVERRVMGPDTTLIERFEYDYQRKRRQVERRFDRQGRLTHRKLYSYPWWTDVTGGVESRVMASKDSLLWSVTYRFDEQGREVQKSLYGPKGRLSLQITYRYDRRGYLFQKIGAEKRSYRFSNIDRHGNWRRRVNSEGGLQKSITLRKIIYRKTAE